MQTISGHDPIDMASPEGYGDAAREVPGAEAESEVWCCQSRLPSPVTNLDKSGHPKRDSSPWAPHYAGTRRVLEE
jgi:hypothetical protein